MKISTRGRYALRVVIDLAEQGTSAPVRLKDISERQEISLKYLESIMTLLSKNNIVEGLSGKGGGYRLTRNPADYSVGEILRLTEGSLAPIACLDPGAKPCERLAGCRTIGMWTKLNNLINDYLDSVSIADLMKENYTSDMYVI
jgi:Rrf2 family transcriptional regulator, iron-sulfur cluster assembly transcription factor